MLNTIKKARLTNGIKQKDFAAMLGVSQASVCNWERGVSHPNVKRLKQVADVLGISVEEIITEKVRAG